MMMLTALLCSSCGLFDNADGTVNTGRLNQITALVQSGSGLGTSAVLNRDDGSKYLVAFRVASDALEALVDGQNFNPDQVDALLRKKLDDELQNAQVSVVYDAILSLATAQYRVFYEQNISKYASDNPVYASFLTAIKNGLDSALVSYGSKGALVAGPRVNPLESLTREDLTL
jgi:hypothetical protein